MSSFTNKNIEQCRLIHSVIAMFSLLWECSCAYKTFKVTQDKYFWRNFIFQKDGTVHADIAGGKEAEGVWEHGVEENIWT